jgi:hypothetical protein
MSRAINILKMLVEARPHTPVLKKSHYPLNPEPIHGHSIIILCSADVRGSNATHASKAIIRPFE